MTINNKSERNYRGKCLGSPVTSYGGASDHVIFCLLCKMSTIHNDIWSDFPKIFDHFPKISQDSLKLVQRLDESFQTFPFQRLPKTTKEDAKMFRSYTNKFRYS